jgi:glutamine amidotransferase-like uncharacterized protein
MNVIAKNRSLKTMVFLITCSTIIGGLCSCTRHFNELTGDGIVTVGIYAGEGASGVCYSAAEKMFQWMGFETERLYGQTINSGDIEHIDIFYFPGGNAGLYDGFINDSGKQRIRDAITSGRGYIGTCGGAYYAASYLEIFPGTLAGPIPGMTIEMCQVYLTSSHIINHDQPASIWILYYNSPYFDPDSNAIVDTVGFYNISGYPALVACHYGEGRVFLTGPHPEWEENSDRDGVSLYDTFDDVESDWPMMFNAARWCLRDFEAED